MQAMSAILFTNRDNAISTQGFTMVKKKKQFWLSDPLKTDFLTIMKCSILPLVSKPILSNINMGTMSVLWFGVYIHDTSFPILLLLV